MLNRSAVIAQVNLPDGVGPSFDGPVTGIVLILLNAFLGIVALGLVALFVVGLVKAVNAMNSNKKEGAGTGIAMSIASIVVLIFVFGIGATINGWVDWLT